VIFTGNTVSFVPYRFGNAQMNGFYASGAYGQMQVVRNTFLGAGGQDTVDLALACGANFVGNFVDGGYLSTGLFLITSGNLVSGNGLLGTAVWNTVTSGSLLCANGIKTGINGVYGPYGRTGSGVTLSRNTIQNAWIGVTTNNGPGGESAESRAVFSGNFLYNIRAIGMSLGTGTQFEVANNTIINCSGSATNSFFAGLYVSGASDIVAYNNILHRDPAASFGANIFVLNACTLVGGSNNLCDNLLTLNGTGAYSPSPADTTLSLAALGLDSVTGKPSSSSAAALSGGTTRGYRMSRDGRPFVVPTGKGAYIW
jgi:hypothetical protein